MLIKYRSQKHNPTILISAPEPGQIDPITGDHESQRLGRRGVKKRLYQCLDPFLRVDAADVAKEPVSIVRVERNRGPGTVFVGVNSVWDDRHHVIGDTDAPVYGQLGSPMIMHRRSVLEFATWGEPDAAEDWKLVELWIASGVQYVPVKQVTVDVYPSTFANLL